MGAGIGQAVRHGRYHRRNTAARQNGNRGSQADQHGPFHFIRFNFLSQEFRCPAHHQSCNKHRQNGKGQHSVQAASHTAEDDLPQLHLQQLDHPAQRRIAVMHGVNGTVGCRGGENAPGGRGRNAEPGLLTLHVSTGLIDGGKIHSPVLRQLGRSRLLTDAHNAQTDHQHQQHGQEDGNALLFVIHSLPESEAQCCLDQQQREHFNQVCERAGVFQGMGGVDPHEAAAVGAGLLDGHLAGRRSHGNKLLRHDLGVNRFSVYRYLPIFRVNYGIFYDFSLRSHRNGLQQRDSLAAFEVLDYAAADQQQGNHQIQREQNVEHNPGQIHPETAQSRRFHLNKSPDQGKQYRNTRGGRHKILHSQPQRLGQVTEGGFPGIGLPVGVCHKAGGSVECQIPCYARQVLRIARQRSLQQLEKKQKHQSDPGKEQYAECILFPVHLFFRVDPHDPVNCLFAWGQYTRKKGMLPVHDLFHVTAQRNGQYNQNGQIQHILDHTVHVWSSPFIKMYTYHSSIAAAHSPVTAITPCTLSTSFDLSWRRNVSA